VKTMDSVRFSGKLVEALPQGEIRRAIEGQIERQRRFPLDTANALRGPTAPRRLHHIQERFEGRLICLCGQAEVPGARSDVCRKHRRSHRFIETNPMISMRELPLKLLGFARHPFRRRRFRSIRLRRSLRAPNRLRLVPWSPG